MACLVAKEVGLNRTCATAVEARQKRTGGWRCVSSRELVGIGALTMLLRPSGLRRPPKCAASPQREIKIGQTMPYSGPVSAFGALGKGEVGYFKMLNERGGINGRKINLISLDDSYAPPKTVEQTRRLVESDEVALIFSSIGTAHNTAIAKYLQSKNIPQLFIGSGASKFADISAISAGDAGRAGAVPLRGAALRALCAGQESERQIRRDFAERRFRPRLSAGPEGRARRQIRFRSSPRRPTKSRTPPSIPRSSS